MNARVVLAAPLPRKVRKITFLAAFFALAPLVLLTIFLREDTAALPMFVPLGGMLSDLVWSLADPGRLLPRLQILLLDATGLRDAGMPLFGLVLGSLVLMLATVAPATVRTTPRRRVAAGALLGLTPGFLLAVTMGAPVLWGLASWAVCVRAMGPCEGRDNIQQEMSMAFGLCFLLLGEPLALLLVGPTLLGLPLLLRRREHRATIAAMVLATTPPLLMLAAIGFALTILTHRSPLVHLARWMDALATTDPTVPLVVIGPPMVVVMALVAVPSLVLLGIALRDRRRRYHPMALVLGAVAPALGMCVLAWRGHDDAARILALYSVAGQAMWLAQTPLPRRRFRWGMGVALFGLLGQYML